MSVKEHPEYKNFYMSHHPLMQHKLALLRDITTNRSQFKALVNEITSMLVYESCANLAIQEITINTPLESCRALQLEQSDPVILPILRAGLGMVDGFLHLLPNARVGHIGLFRDEESLQPQQYYFKIPKECEHKTFLICDPMLATGGSAKHTINYLKSLNISDIKFVCLVAAPEGVKTIHNSHPDVPIYAAALDRQLNQNGYIVPGLGDAGDRLFGTM